MTDSPVDVNTSMIYFFVPIEDDDLAVIVDLVPIDGLYDNEIIMVTNLHRCESKANPNLWSQ